MSWGGGATWGIAPTTFFRGGDRPLYSRRLCSVVYRSAVDPSSKPLYSID